MARSFVCLGCLACAASLLYVPFSFADPSRGETVLRPKVETNPFRTRTPTSALAARMVPIDALPTAIREKVRRTVIHPTLVTHAAGEEFRASPEMYQWLLEHPDRAALAWRRLGIPCSPIEERSPGLFGWRDDIGSDVHWWIIARSDKATIWYAEGQVKAGPLLPAVPVRSVVVLRHEMPAVRGGVIRHEIDIFCFSDSRAAALAYRLFGASADRLAEQAAEQMLTFFSALARYFEEHPNHASRLLASEVQARGRSR